MLASSSNMGATRRLVVPAVLGLLLVGGIASPAHSDPARSEQWHLDAMQAEKMWGTSTGKGITVAVIDSGVDAANPDLEGRVLEGMNLERDVPGDELEDYSGHGTGMAGIIAGTGAAQGGNGAFGLAPGVKILPVRMPEADGAANQAAADREFHESISKAIRFAVDRDAEVINISLGVKTSSQQLDEAVKYALGRGALIFASVGNSGDGANLIEYPAGTPGVVGVGAIGKDLQKTEESQSGSQVDLAAPGEEMVHACGGSSTGMCKTSGTSDATAVVSASAALIWSKHPDWTNNQVLRVMLNTAGGPISGDERTDYIGYGGVRPRIALTTPGDPGPADEYPLPDLAAAESPKPSPEPSKPAAGSEESDKPAAAAPATDDGGNTGLWIGLGIGAAALIGVAVAVLAVRSRRRTAAPTAPQTYRPPHPQQAQPAYPQYGPPPGGPEAGAPYGGPSGPTA